MIYSYHGTVFYGFYSHKKSIFHHLYLSCLIKSPFIFLREQTCSDRHVIFFILFNKIVWYLYSKFARFPQFLQVVEHNWLWCIQPFCCTYSWLSWILFQHSIYKVVMKVYLVVNQKMSLFQEKFRRESTMLSRWSCPSWLHVRWIKRWHYKHKSGFHFFQMVSFLCNLLCKRSCW